MPWIRYLAYVTSVAMLACGVASTKAEVYELQHVHKTASIFMDPTEMHAVKLEVFPDGVSLSFTGSFRSSAGSRVLHCDLPSFIRSERLIMVDVESGEQWYQGGGHISRLRIEIISDRNKREAYTFVSGTAVRFNKYDAYRLNGGLEWKEGADGGGLVRSAEEAIRGVIAPIHHEPPLPQGETPSQLSARFNIPPELRPELVEGSGHSASVDALVVTPDYKWLISAGHDFSIRLWDLGTFREVRIIGRHSREVNALAVCPDSRCVISASNDQTIKVWELPSGRFLRSFTGHASSVQCLAITTDGRWLISGSGDPPNFENRKSDFTVRIWDFRSGSEIRRLEGHTNIIASVDVSPDSRALATGSFDGTIKTWDLESGKLIRTIAGFNGEVRARFTADALHLVSASAGRLRTWDAYTGHATEGVSGSPWPYQVALNSSRTRVAYPTRGSVEILSIATGSHTVFRRSDNTGQKIAESITFGRDDQLIAGYNDGAVKVWDVNTQSEVDMSGYAAAVDSIAVSMDGHWLASGNRDASIKLWDSASGGLVGTLQSENNIIDALAFSADGRWLASSGLNYSGSGNVGIEIWDVTNQMRRFRFEHPTKKVEFLTFSPDGRWLASGAVGNTVKIWDMSSGTELRTLSPAYKAISFASDGRWVATGSMDGSLTYWELPSGQVIRRQSNLGWAYASSMNGRWLASTGWRNDFKVWDVEKAAQWSQRNADPGQIFAWNPSLHGRVHTFHGHKDFVSDVSFSPNNHLIASGSWDGEIKLWDIESAREIRTLTGHNSAIQSLAFSQDGARLFSGGWDGTLRVWDVNSGEELVALISARNSNDWLAVAPTGLFDGKADAMAIVGWREHGSSSGVLPLEGYFDDYFRPGLLAEIMDGQHPKPVIDVAAVLRIPGLRAMLHDSTKPLHLDKIGDAAYACFTERPTAHDTVSADAVRCPYGIRLPRIGRPEELISVLDRPEEHHDNPWSGSKIADTTESALHVLTVGIDQYTPKANLPSLPSSVSTANEIDNFFEQQNDSGNRLFKSIRLWNTPPLRNELATRQAIRERFREMSSAMDENDVVLLFLSGHGEVPEDQELFYFDPVDFVGTTAEERRKSGLSTAMLADAIREMPAHRVVVIVDACQSGGAVDSLSRIGEVKIRVEEKHAKAEMNSNLGRRGPKYAAGVYVIAAASPVEQGGQDTGSPKTPLAVAFLEALENGQRDGDGKIWMDEVVRRIRQRVPDISGRSGIRYTPLVSVSGANFPIALTR